jgi:hypothetical protein
MAAIGYVVTALPASGNGIPLTLSPALFTSVAYTSPASASPEATLPRTSATDDSSLTGLSAVPVSRSAMSAAAPHGTWLAQTTTFTPCLARSGKDETDAGLAGGTAISRMLVAKLLACPRMSAVSESRLMVRVSAEANTSAGAPWEICVARSEDPAKLSMTLVPGFRPSNSPARRVKVSFREAAANTVRVPEVPAGSAVPGEPGAQPDKPAASMAAASNGGTSARTDFTGRSFPSAFPQ